MTGYRLPWDADPHQLPARPPTPRSRNRKPLGRRRQVLAPAGQEDGWVYHRLTVFGPKEDLDAFVASARGTGIVPWHRDRALLEEDLLHWAAAQPPGLRNLSIEGCRILARHVALAEDAHHRHAVERAGHDRSCPFDLHALLPVPDAVLAQGRPSPAARKWITQHWGPADALRQVVVRPAATVGKRLPAAHAVIGYGFASLDRAPVPAVAVLEARWPRLVFRLQIGPND